MRAAVPVAEGVALVVDRTPAGVAEGLTVTDGCAEGVVVGSSAGTWRVNDALPCRPSAAGVPATTTASAARAALIIVRLLEVDGVL